MADNKREQGRLMDEFDKLAEVVAQRYNLKAVPHDKTYKKRINRMFRFFGVKRVPYPEVDSLWEKFLSRLSNLKKLGK